MSQNELEKGMDAYKQKTALFPHSKVISKSKKRKKNIKVNSPKER